MNIEQAILEKLTALEKEIAALRLERSPGRVLKTKEAAEYLGIGTTQLRRLEKAGLLASIAIDGDLRFEVAELEQFKQRCRKNLRRAA